MNSKEIIKRTIQFKKPERLGFYYRVGETLHSDLYIDKPDKPHFDDKRHIENHLEQWVDEWGNTWGRVTSDKTTGGEVIKGVLDNWDDFDNYKLPDISHRDLFEGMKQRFSSQKELYKLAESQGFCFSIARKLRRLDNFLMDVKLEREKIIELLQQIETLLSRMIVNYAQSGADGIIFYEDWGTQQQLLIHPNDWIDIFKPSFARLCELAHKNNLDVWMHSCGYIYHIIKHMIDVGIDVLQLDQPELIGIEKLGKEFGGKITFWSPCDIQKILPTGDKDLIEKSIYKMLHNLYINNGGFISKSYGLEDKDLISIGVKPEWNEFAYKCFLKYNDKLFK